MPWRGGKLGSLAAFGGYFAATNLVFYVAHNLEKILFPWLFGPSAELAIGLFSQAMNFVMRIVSLFTAAFSGVMLPALSRAPKDTALFAEIIGRFFRMTAIGLFPCGIGLFLVAPDVMLLELKLPANERLQFLAGQYIDILMKDGRRRSFSMANAPHDDAFLQLHLRNYGGPFSEYVFTRMKEKEILRFEGPLGTFFLREDSDKPIILLASGTGFAPIKAIVEHALHKGIRRPMSLYWGGRVRSDLYLNALAVSWASAQHLRYVPVLSEARPEDAWTGRTGFVHRAVMEDGPDLSGYQVYACGSPLMVEAAHRDFTTRCGLPEEEFYSDAFTPAAPG